MYKFYTYSGWRNNRTTIELFMYAFDILITK